MTERRAIDITITLSDLEDVRRVLEACNNLVVAADLSEAQRRLVALMPSPLSQEVERIRARMDAYLADHLLAEHDGDPEGEPGEDQEPEGPEELADLPLGQGPSVRQAGRRLTREELEARDGEREAEEEAARDEVKGDGP